MKKFNDNKFYFFTTFGLLGLSAFLYYFAKLFQTNYNLIGSSIDNIIPFIPIFIYIYNIWYPFEMLSLFFIYKDSLKIYTKTIISLLFSFIISTSIFIIYPTTINRPNIDSYNNLTELITYITYKADTPAINCFPSNHCILCFTIIFSVLAIKNMSKKKKYIIIFINILIILSTSLVKQHVLYDVIGSLIISSICFYILSKFKFFKKLEKKLAYFS